MRAAESGEGEAKPSCRHWDQLAEMRPQGITRRAEPVRLPEQGGGSRRDRRWRGMRGEEVGEEEREARGE